MEISCPVKDINESEGKVRRVQERMEIVPTGLKSEKKYQSDSKNLLNHMQSYDVHGTGTRNCMAGHIQLLYSKDTVSI